MKSLYVLIGLSLFLTSCVKKLEKEDAQKLLESINLMDYKSQFTTNYQEKIISQYYNGVTNTCNYGGGWGATICSEPFLDAGKDFRYLNSRDKEVLQYLEKFNYISLTDSVDYSSCCQYSYKLIKLGKKAKDVTSLIWKDDKSYTITTISPHINRITGIKTIEDGKKVEIEFDLKFECNEIGMILYGSHCSSIELESFIAQVEMYDDGWRITDIRKKPK